MTERRDRLRDEMINSNRRRRAIYYGSNRVLGIFFIAVGLYGLLGGENNTGGGLVLLWVIFIGLLCLRDSIRVVSDYVSPSRRRRWEKLNGRRGDE